LTTAVVAMSALGFLFYNFPPARIFMGDVGSIPLGFSAGTLMLLGLRDGLFDFWVPILIFSPFILDATLTVLRRAWRRERIWEAHREHYYQRTVLSGWSHRQTVVAEYGIMLCCGSLAVLYHGANDAWRVVILGMWALLFTSLAVAVDLRERDGAGKRQ
jgi:UDP-N-acetylmuramyl pentapeptide phosphotransferase/UDP-N-acetylglucosamine-1-phosphate transferase